MSYVIGWPLTSWPTGCDVCQYLNWAQRSADAFHFTSETKHLSPQETPRDRRTDMLLMWTLCTLLTCFPLVTCTGKTDWCVFWDGISTKAPYGVFVSRPPLSVPGPALGRSSPRLVRSEAASQCLLHGGDVTRRSGEGVSRGDVLAGGGQRDLPEQREDGRKDHCGPTWAPGPTRGHWEQGVVSAAMFLLEDGVCSSAQHAERSQHSDCR